MTVRNAWHVLSQESLEKKMLYLSEFDLFQGLPQSDMEEITRVTTMTNVPKGRTFWPTEMKEVLFILKKGHVQIYRLTPQGKKLVITTLGPGSIFGEMVLTGQRMLDAFAETVDDCLICVISRADMERIIMSKPLVGLRLLEIMGRRLYEAERRLEELAFKTIPARLATLLLHLREQQGDTIKGYTHQDLAEIVGTYRETITQVLNDMKAKGLIETGRKSIHILDSEGLAALAEG